MQRQDFRFTGLFKFRRDNHRVKPAGCRQTAVKFAQVARLVIVAFFKRYQVLQVLLADLRSFERHIAKTIAFTAVVVDVPEGLTPLQRYAKLAFIKLAVEIAFT